VITNKIGVKEMYIIHTIVDTAGSLGISSKIDFMPLDLRIVSILRAE